MLRLIDELRRAKEPDVVQAIAFLESTGIRFNSVLEEVMTPIMYDVPSDDSIAKVIITPEAIRGEQPPEVVREEGRPARPRLGAASLRAEPGGQAARKGNAS